MSDDNPAAARELPPEIWHEILLFLRRAPSDVLAFAQVCRMFRELVDASLVGVAPSRLALQTAAEARAFAVDNGGCFNALSDPRLLTGLISGLLNRARRPSHPSGLRVGKFVETIALSIKFIHKEDVVVNDREIEGVVKSRRFRIKGGSLKICLPHANKPRLRVGVFLTDYEAEACIVDVAEAEALVAAETGAEISLAIYDETRLRAFKKNKKVLKKALARKFDFFVASTSMHRLVPRLIGPAVHRVRKVPARWDPSEQPSFGRFLVDEVSWWWVVVAVAVALPGVFPVKGGVFVCAGVVAVAFRFGTCCSLHTRCPLDPVRPR